MSGQGVRPCVTFATLVTGKRSVVVDTIVVPLRVWNRSEREREINEINGVSLAVQYPLSRARVVYFISRWKSCLVARSNGIPTIRSPRKRSCLSFVGNLRGALRTALRSKPEGGIKKEANKKKKILYVRTLFFIALPARVTYRYYLKNNWIISVNDATFVRVLMTLTTFKDYRR